MKNVEYFWDLPFACISLNEIAKQVMNWALNKENRIIYCCGMSDVVLAQENPKLKKCLQNADLLTADGMPLVFLMRKRKGEMIERGYGPDIFKKVLKMSGDKKINHFFMGTTENNLKKIIQIVKNDFGNSNKLNYYSPPFKEKFNDNDLDKMARLIEKSNSDIVWIGMGSLKQIFLADSLSKKTKGKIFVTVGAAFDFLTGNKKQAPILMQKMGLEWLFRLASEPKRLFKRYIKIIGFVFKEIYRKNFN